MTVETYISHGQGSVRDRSTDGRLRENRDAGVSQGKSRKNRITGSKGRVAHPSTDKRLRANRGREC